MNIKCEKCGFMNEAEPESQCSNCGEHLYQFYIKNLNKTKRRKIIKISSIIAIVVIIIGLLLFIGTIPKKELSVMDPVKKDLIEYLKQINIQEKEILTRDEAKSFKRYILGYLDENEERVILATMGLQDIPNPVNKDGYDKYWNMWSNKSEQIMKSKSIKEKFKIYQDYYNIEARYYSRITPITNEVESIHKCLIRSKEFAAKAYNNFLSGLSLGYISNVKETKDGELRWSFNIRSREYSDNFNNYLETSDNESKTYFRMLEQLVLKYNLLKEYKAAYPLKGYIKERNIKESQIK